MILTPAAITTNTTVATADMNTVLSISAAGIEKCKGSNYDRSRTSGEGIVFERI